MFSLAVAATLALGACAGNGSTATPPSDDVTVTPTPTETVPDPAPTSDGGDGTQSPTVAPEPSTPLPGGDGTELTDDEYLAAALAAVATAEAHTSGVAIEIDDLDDGKWDVDVRTDDGAKWEVDVSADGTTVLKSEPDTTDIAEMPTIRIKEAIEIAMNNTPGRFQEAELKQESGFFFWKVTLDNGDDDVDVHLDAHTGEIFDV